MVHKILEFLSAAEAHFLAYFGAGEGWYFEAISLRSDGVWFDLYNERGLLEGVHCIAYDDLKEI